MVFADLMLQIDVTYIIEGQADFGTLTEPRHVVKLRVEINRSVAKV